MPRLPARLDDPGGARAGDRRGVRHVRYRERGDRGLPDRHRWRGIAGDARAHRDGRLTYRRERDLVRYNLLFRAGLCRWRPRSRFRSLYDLTNLAVEGFIE